MERYMMEVWMCRYSGLNAIMIMIIFSTSSLNPWTVSAVGHKAKEQSCHCATLDALLLSFLYWYREKHVYPFVNIIMILFFNLKKCCPTTYSNWEKYLDPFVNRIMILFSSFQSAVLLLTLREIHLSFFKYNKDTLKFFKSILIILFFFKRIVNGPLSKKVSKQTDKPEGKKDKKTNS